MHAWYGRVLVLVQYSFVFALLVLFGSARGFCKNLNPANHISEFQIRAFPAKGSKPSKSPIDTFICEECGVQHIKWVGRCTSCKEWNTVKPFRVQSNKLPPAGMAPIGLDTRHSPNAVWLPTSEQALIQMSDVSLDSNTIRLKSWSTEVNRVLGGGLVRGSVVLLAGEPGIGKSTLLLQIVASLARSDSSVVYVSGEETAEQIVSRAQRLKLSPEGVYIFCETDVDKAVYTLSSMERHPVLVIVDSVQTMRTSDSAGGAGSVSQIRDSTVRFLQLAKSTGSVVLLVGHVTKSGEVAGPRVLEHMVDAVLYMEGSDRGEHRLIRGVKNRFGSTSEVGVMRMTGAGLVDVLNPSELFVNGVSDVSVEGSAVAIIIEGSRPITAEIQCLVGGSSAAKTPRRATDGFPITRLQLLCAVVERRLKLTLWNREVYLNVVGGLRIDDPASDLAAAIAIISSLLGVPVRAGTAFVGEVGLGGDIRCGRQLESRMQEAKKMGFLRVVIPRPPAAKGRRQALQEWTGADEAMAEASGAMEVCACRDLKEAIAAALDMDCSVDDMLRRHRSRSRKGRSESPSSLGMGGEDEEGDDELGWSQGEA